MVPAIIIALSLSFPFLAWAYTTIFKEKLGDDGFYPVPSFTAFICAAAVGIFIPLISSILPIMKILDQNLNDSLNYSRSRVKAIYISILKSS